MFPDFDDMLAQFREAMESLRLPPEFNPPGLSDRRVFASVGLDQATLACIEAAALAMDAGHPAGAEKFRIEGGYGHLMPESMIQFADGRHDWGWPK